MSRTHLVEELVGAVIQESEAGQHCKNCPHGTIAGDLPGRLAQKLSSDTRRLRKKGYDMVGPTKGDKGHTRAWLAAIEAADAMG